MLTRDNVERPRHTPGPLRHDGSQYSPTITSDAQKIAHCIVSEAGEYPTIFLESLVTTKEEEEQLAANAALFIAAPALYEAAKAARALRISASFAERQKVMEQLDAALAQVDGPDTKGG